MIRNQIDNLHRFFKARITEGYTLHEAYRLTIADVEAYNNIFGVSDAPEKDEDLTTLDKAFPFLFG